MNVFFRLLATTFFLFVIVPSFAQDQVVNQSDKVGWGTTTDPTLSSTSISTSAIASPAAALAATQSPQSNLSASPNGALTEEVLLALLTDKSVRYETEKGVCEMRFFSDKSLRTFCGGFSDQGTWQIQKSKAGTHQVLCRKYNQWPEQCHAIVKEEFFYIGLIKKNRMKIISIKPL